MFISREISRHGNLLPSILNVVSNLPESIQSYIEYKSLPAETIAFRSVYNVIVCFERMVNSISEVELLYATSGIESIQRSIISRLEDDYVSLLASITAYIEDCQHIFKVTMPYQEINEKFVSNWLQKAKHPTSQKFFNEVKSYRNEIARITNAKKHQYGRIDILFGQKGGSVAIGFVIKDIVMKSNELRQCLDLNMVQTFNTALRYHFFQFYNISEKFEKHFLQSLMKIHGYEHGLQRKEIEINEFNHLGSWINRQEFIVFPNSEVLSSKTLLRLERGYLQIYNPVGINENIVEYTIRKTMNDGSLILVVPDEDSIGEMQSLQQLNPDKHKFEVPKSFKAKWQLHILTEGNFFQVKYNVGLQFKTWHDMEFVLKFVGGLDLKKIDLIGCELNYLGLLVY